MQGTVADHEFELTNDGTEDLIIKQVKPTCGCTVAQVMVENEAGEIVDYTFGDAIVPGRKVRVPAKLHTKNKSGHQTTRINIFSNDPRGTIQLGLEADIDPFFNIAPRFLNSKRPLARSKTRSVTWIVPDSPWDSIRLAALTVSPQRS